MQFCVAYSGFVSNKVHCTGQRKHSHSMHFLGNPLAVLFTEEMALTHRKKRETVENYRRVWESAPNATVWNQGISHFVCVSVSEIDTNA